MKKKSIVKTIAELFVIPTGILAINLFFPGDPGFLKSIINPYFIYILIVAALYGKYSALACFGFCIFAQFIPLPFLIQLLYGKDRIPGYWTTLLARGIIPYSQSILLSFFIGVIRDLSLDNLKKSKQFLKTVGRGKGLLQKELKALKMVNFTLEKRVLTQKDSIIALYSRIQKLYNANFQKAMEIIIETVRNFSEATSCSIWEYKQEKKKLELLLQRGWPDTDEKKISIEAESSIEGWVVRNNIMFSAKMVMQYENLKQMDEGRNIYTVPILAGHKVWGVLNIEKLPFEKYNLYTEKLLLIVMTLVAPALERSFEYEAFNITESIDPVTSLPLFSQFYIILEKEIAMLQEEQGTLSIVIIELSNYSDYLDTFEKKYLFKFLHLLSEKITTLSQNKTIFFHYKSDNQLCMIYPNADFDGCSLFCLNMLEMINSKEWALNEKIIHPEIILGYASLGDQTQSTDTLIDAAENLLNMQKV